MLDVRKIIEECFESITVREKGEYSLVTPLFFHIDSDESIALKFSEAEDGRPIISDCGTTRDYLEISNIDLDDYRQKSDAVKERFSIDEKDGVFSMTIPTRDPKAVGKYVGYFIQAISIIANIDL